MNPGVAEPWPRILDDARWYPSPHNSQPITVTFEGDDRAVLSYDKQRGLPAEDLGVPFGSVCMGVFLGCLQVAAAGHGFRLTSEIGEPGLDFDDTGRYHRFAEVQLHPEQATPEAMTGLQRLRRRRTSRRPYDNTVLPTEVTDRARELAAGHGHQLATSTDRELVDKIIEINAATLFDDLRREPVYLELMQWLRFSKRDAAVRADGLSAETMLIPGAVLRAMLRHRGLWDAPVIGRLVRSIYLRTMTGVRQVAWLTGPFASPADHLAAGRCFIDLWLMLTGAGVALHPYGTVITNPRSHRALVDLVGQAEEGDELTWLLFRLGHSADPPPSHRRPWTEMVISPEELATRRRS